MDSLDSASPISLLDYGIGEIARRMSAVAAFIKNEFCEKETARAPPLYGFMQSIYSQLVNYGWPLVREDKLEVTLLPHEARHMSDPQHIARAMDALVPFFELRAESYAGTAMEKVNTGLAKDLSFAAQYIRLTLGVTHGAPEAQGQQENVVSFPTPEPTPPIEESVLSTEDPLPEPERSPPGSTDFKTLEAVSFAEPSPQFASIDDVLESALAQDQCQEERRSTQQIDDLLRGRHLDSRSWFKKDLHFAELIGEPRQWTESEPEHYCLVPSSSLDGSQHYIDALPLGISAVNIIALQHPLDVAAVQALDIDILRFIRLMLWDWTNGHAEREAAKESLEIVRAEIARRRLEGEEARKDAIEEHSVVAIPKTPVVCGQNDAQTNSFTPLPPSFLDPYSYGNYEGMLAEEEENPAGKASGHGPSAGNADLESLPNGTLTPKPNLEAATLETFQAQILDLQSQIAALTSRVASLEPLDEARKGTRTDETASHPLQALAGSSSRRTSSVMGDAGSDIDEQSRIEEDDLEKYIPPRDMFRGRGSPDLGYLYADGGRTADVRPSLWSSRYPSQAVSIATSEGESEEDQQDGDKPGTQVDDQNEDDHGPWLDPLSSGSSTPRTALRSCRGRRRIEDVGRSRQSPGHDWHDYTSRPARIPSKVVTMKKCEMLLNSLDGSALPN